MKRRSLKQTEGPEAKPGAPSQSRLFKQNHEVSFKFTETAKKEMLETKLNLKKQTKRGDDK